MMLEALMRDAAAAFKAGDLRRAEPIFRQIVAFNPRDAQAWHGLALIACSSGRANEAFDYAMRAHKLDTRNPLFLNMVGASCMESGRQEESLRWFRRALKERPGNAETHYNLARVLSKLRQYEAAEKAYRCALQIEPAMGDAANNLARLCIRTGRFDEAQELLDRARTLTPDAEAVVTNSATVLLARRGPAAAIECLESFIKGHPDAAQAHFTLALHLLADGRFVQGWREYAWRRLVPEQAPPPGLVHSLPDDLRGGTVVLVPEQGLGDQLFFLRFAPLLRRRGAKVIFAGPQKLTGMLTGAPGLDRVIAGESDPLPELPERALMASVADLPRLLGGDSVPPPLSIPVQPERVCSWAERLAALGPPPYLGATWRAGTANQVTSEFAPAGLAALSKEIKLEALGQAVRRWPGTLLILQRLPEPGEIAAFSRAAGRSAHDLSALNEQLEDMAAVLALIEEYAGVSNTNMHIRAGVGKAARVLVPFPPEFRWMHAGQASPWFPGFRVYRQPTSLDWTESLDILVDDLRAAP